MLSDRRSGKICAMFAWLISRIFSANEQYFYLTINQPTVLSTMTYQQAKGLISHIHDTYAQHGDMPRPRARCQFAGCYLHAIEIDRSSAQGRTQEAVHHCTTS